MLILLKVNGIKRKKNFSTNYKTIFGQAISNKYS